jgi:hypothetical protein
MSIKNLLFLSILIYSPFLWSQGVGINETGNNPDPSAILDVQSADKGFLTPRMTSAQRNSISNPAKGLMIFNLDENCSQINLGASASPIWHSITSGIDGKTLLSGTTNPASPTGTVGDFYINTTTNQLFGPKTAGGWGTGVNLIGPQGVQGPIGLTGATGPQGVQGPQGVIGATGPTGLLTSGAVAGNTPYWNGTTWVVNSSNIFNSGGNVGIATSNPSTQFHLVGTPTTQTTSSNNIFRQTIDDNSFLRYQERLNITGSNTQVDIDPFSVDASGNINFRFFRHSNTNGSKHVDFLRGNGTTQGSARIGVDGVSSYFQLQGGNFGIGVSSPTSKLEVNGAVTNTTALNAGSNSTIDFALSNLAYTSATETTIALQNLKNGGAYTLIFTNNTASGTVSFTATGFTFVQMSTFARTAGKKHIYNFVVVGTEVYVTMAREN